MSVWTHIIGSIYIDTMAFLGKNFEKVLKEKFGRTVSFSDSQRKWNRCNVPRGSEGSIQYKIIRGGESGTSYSGGEKEAVDYRWIVTIWGDLRDYDTPKEIIQWIEQATKGLFVREGIIKLYVEGQDHIILRHTSKGWEQITAKGDY